MCLSQPAYAIERESRCAAKGRASARSLSRLRGPSQTRVPSGLFEIDPVTSRKDWYVDFATGYIKPRNRRPPSSPLLALHTHTLHPARAPHRPDLPPPTFAAQYPSVGYPTFFELHAPPSYADPLSDYLAQQRQRQRELALREVEAAERRRAVQAELEAATYRAALVAEVERRRRQAAYAAARDQHRRFQERRRLAEARRARQRQPVAHGAFPSQLLELVFQLDPSVNHLGQRDDVELSESSADEEEDEPVVHLVPLGTHNDSALSAADSDDDSTVDSEGTSVEEDDSDLSDAESAASSSSAYRDSALSTLASLSSELASRRSTFVSPTTLTFSPSPSPADRAARSPTPPLAFGSANASFLGYEEALLSLLTRIDAVESHGDREVQQARKELVRDVERELRRLDEIRDRAWEEQSGSSSGESDADDEAMGDAEDDDEDAVMEQEDEDEGESPALVPAFGADFATDVLARFF